MSLLGILSYLESSFTKRFEGCLPLAITMFESEGVTERIID
jgi:hypothetical protein